MSTPIEAIWIIFQIFIGYNLILPILLYLFKLLRSPKTLLIADLSINPDYAIIVTAYEQTNTLSAVVDSLLKLNYQNYLIYIVADKCNITDLNFDKDKVILLRPEEELKSNTKSHFYAIDNFFRPHSFVTIIDSDNLVDSNYLNELNQWFCIGYEAVQGVRNAKNLDTTYACLDAARDIYYHFFDGKILFNIGSSATLAGSGMAFTTKLYRECLEHLEISGAGFDKVLQYEILRRNLRIAFAEKAIVYDEKTSRSDQLVSQRSRWINTWFKYFKFGFILLALGFKKFSRNQTIFGLILLRPPLFIFLILSFALMIINIWLSPIILLLWIISFALFISGFILSLIHSKANPKIYASLINIPKFMFFQVLSLLKVRKANKISVATTHYHNQVLDQVKQ